MLATVVESAAARRGPWGGRGAHPRPLVDGGQERAAERPRRGDRRVDDDESRQVLVLGAEAVQRPGTERGADELRGARVQLREGLEVGRQVGGHRVDHAQPVGVSGDLVEQARHPEATPAAPAELPARRQQGRAAPATGGRRRRLAGVGDEFRLVVERIHVRRPPLHAEEDHVLGAGGEVRRPGGQRAGDRLPRRRLGGERREGEEAEAVGGVPEECPPRPAGHARTAVVWRREGRHE
jgi:hypothetical protein